MININYGKNEKLLDACEPLKEYSWLMDRIRTYIKEGLDTLDAINKAIRETPDEFVLKQFLVSHETEVSGLLLTEYDEAKTMELFRRDGIEEGKEIGRKEGRAEGSKKATDLINYLWSHGRSEDAMKASSDPSFLQKLLAEFAGMTPAK